MAQSTPASAGPNASSPATVAMRDSNNQPPTATAPFKPDEIFSPIIAPPPLLSRWPEYAPALPMSTDDPNRYRTATTVESNNRNSCIVLDLTIQLDHPTVSNNTSDPPPPSAMKTEANSGGLCTICRSKTHTFYRPQMPLFKVIEQAMAISDDNIHSTSSPPIPTHLLPYVTLYDAQKRAVWSLTARSQNTLDFVAQQQQYRISLVTATLSFQWINGQSYRWRLMPSNISGKYDLRCYHQDGKLVAEFLAGSRYVVWSHTTAGNKINPFRQSTSMPDATTAANNSSNDSNLGNSSSNSNSNSDGSEDQGDMLSAFLLLTGLLLLDNIGSTTVMATHTDTEEDDTVSMTSSMYYADQGLVDATPSSGRWYGGGSVKSIELDPGLMHCWWGIGCCWSWCPCCMPGGWCDRLRWGLLQRKHESRHTSTISRSRQRRQQGWSQQPPDQY